MKRLLKLLAPVLCLALALCVPGRALEADALRVPEDGTLKIAVFADTQTTQNVPRNLLDDLCAVLDQEQPDLVVYLGDQVEGKHPYVHIGDNEVHVKRIIDQVLSPVTDRGIPFAVVFGNHDAQDSGVAKEVQMAYYQTFPGCLAADEGDALPGCGTYHLLYWSSDGARPVVDLYFIDSLEYDPGGGYGCVSREQVQWCREQMDALTQANGGTPVPALCFQHIIVPEIYDALTPAQDKNAPDAFEGKGIGAGSWYMPPEGLLEAPCPPDYSNGQLAAWRESGSVAAAFFAHDHKNSFTVPLDGIDLVACPGTTYTSYHDDGARGVRIIQIDQAGGYDSWIVRPQDGADVGWGGQLRRLLGRPYLWEFGTPLAVLLTANAVFWPVFLHGRRKKRVPAASKR